MLDAPAYHYEATVALDKARITYIAHIPVKLDIPKEETDIPSEAIKEGSNFFTLSGYDKEGREYCIECFEHTHQDEIQTEEGLKKQFDIDVDRIGVELHYVDITKEPSSNRALLLSSEYYTSTDDTTTAHHSWILRSGVFCLSVIEKGKKSPKEILDKLSSTLELTESGKDVKTI